MKILLLSISVNTNGKLNMLNIVMALNEDDAFGHVKLQGR